MCKRDKHKRGHSHWHVEGHDVPLRDAGGLEGVRNLANFVLEFVVSDVLHVPGLVSLPNNGSLIFCANSVESS